VGDLVPITQRSLALTGRALLGLYFIVPGISKVAGYDGTVEYMAAHDVPLISLLLPLTILLQIGGGFALAVGLRTALVSFVLAGLTFVISMYMHDFWSYAEGIERQHETQNFVKNMAIMAGLLCLTGMREAPKPTEA